MQERALFVIYNSHSDTYEELLRRAYIPSLYNIASGYHSTYVQSENMSRLRLTAFPIRLFAKALHTRYGIVTSCYHLLELYAMANTLLDISGHSYGQNLPKIKEIRLVYLLLE